MLACERHGTEFWGSAFLLNHCIVRRSQLGNYIKEGIIWVKLMDIGLEVLVPLMVLLTILVLLVVVLICRFYLWYKIFHTEAKYKCINASTTKASGYPKLPSFKAGAQAVQAVQILHKQQYTKYSDIEGNHNKLPTSMYHLDLKGKNNRYERLLQGDSRESVLFESDELSSNLSEDCMTYNSDASWPQYSTQLLQQKQLDNGDIKYYEGKLETSRQRFKSDPTIYSKNIYEDKTDDSKNRLANQIAQKTRLSNPIKNRRFSDGKRARRPSAQTLMNISDGEIEFILFYHLEKRLLYVTIKSLKCINLNADNFTGVLEKYNRNDKHRPENKPHLIQDEDGTVTLSDMENLSYMVYVTLSPKIFYKNHTNLAFGTSEVTFNETFTISVLSAEQLGSYEIIFHSLCTFANGEPMVFGEGHVPLKEFKVFQNIPCSVKLAPPSEEFELLQNSLDVLTDLGFLSVVLNYNLIAHKLIIKILQATGLPKIGVTGHPNTSVKTSLYIGKQRHCKKSTSIQKRQREPTYNTTMEFGLSKEKLFESDVLFEIRHHGPMYRTNIGYVIVGSSAQDEGALHWQNMLEFQCFEKMHKIIPTKPDGFIS